MLNKIEIKNAFVHKHTTIEFEEGLTRLYGRNEAGKSLVYEMIRWALFGNKALRSPAPDYKGAEVTLTFTVGDKQYKVHRTSSSATLHTGIELVARSTSAVNKKIVELLGYGLKTFDNVNAMLQGEAEKLTKMRSEERKKFMDELIGAAQIDQLVADYKTDADILAGELKALSSLIQTVAEPKEAPKFTLAEAEKLLAEWEQDEIVLRAQQTTADSIAKQLERVIVLPDPLPTYTKDELNDLLHDQETREATRKSFLASSLPSMGRLRSALPSGGMDVDLVELQATCDKLLEAKQSTRPKFTVDQRGRYRQQHAEASNWDRVTELRVRLDEFASCPRCGKDFSEQSQPIVDEINSLINEARPHANLPSLESLVEDDAAEAEYQRIQSVVLDSQYVSLAHVVGTVDFTKEQWDDYNKKLDELEKIGVPIQDVLASIRSKEAMAERQRLNAELVLARDGLDNLELVLVGKAQAKSNRDAAAQYEVEVKFYEEAQKKNAELLKKVEDKRTEYETNQSVIKALQGFKYYVNTYFLPAVSKAASGMLSTMTNGDRTKITISDRFDITVGGQAVETLSGSTKAIVNIALRLALQYVLTRGTFSVFMGDEIDASFSDDRVEMLAECLAGMKEHLSQIIVISHRNLKADHDVKL